MASLVLGGGFVVLLIYFPGVGNEIPYPKRLYLNRYRAKVLRLLANLLLNLAV